MSALRSCLICVGAFVIQMVVFGVYNNFGLVYHHLLLEFGGSNEETALIGSLATGITFLISPMANIILIKYGFKVHITLSTLLCVLSWALSSCVTKLNILILSYSMLWGFGAGLANHASHVLIQQSFSKRLSLANGIASCGTGVGTLTLGPLLEYLLEHYKFKWAFRIFSFVPLLFLISIVVTWSHKMYNYEETLSDPREKSSINNNSEINKCSNDIHRCKGQYSEEDKTSIETDIVNDIDQTNNSSCRSAFRIIFDKELWRNKSLVLYIIGLSTFLFGYFIPFTFLVEYATRQGIDIKDAQFLIGLLAVASTISKVLLGAVMDSQTIFRRSTFMILTLYVMSLSQLIIPTAKHYWHFCCFSLVFGTFEGFFVGQISAVIVDLIEDKRKIGAAIGNLFSLMSVAVMTGPVVAGKLISVVNSYAIPFYVAAAVSMIGAIVASFLKIFESPPTQSISESNSGSETREMIPSSV